jgi:hypothetical protein
LIASTVLAQTPDEGAISNLLHATFDRPEAQLTIAPIVVVGNNAVAGWVQGEMGGRALLRAVTSMMPPSAGSSGAATPLSYQGIGGREFFSNSQRLQNYNWNVAPWN